MPNHHKKRILFVDDERFFLEGIRRILKGYGGSWQVDYVERGADALEEARHYNYDIIVTDMIMPGMDGLQLLSELRRSERTRDVPVIVLTGANEADLKRRALELDATDLLTKPVHPEDLIARLRSALRTKDYQDQIKAHNQTLETRVRERTAALEASRREVTWRLAKAGEFRDEDTGDHVVRVGCYCRAIAQRLGQEEDFVESIFLASPLHDIGKIGIPDNILLKPGRLTAEERQIMEKHCVFGAEILSEKPRGVRPYFAWHGIDPTLIPADENPVMEMAVQIALNHHEKWDGTGYPRGLAGEIIPLEARITALADVYDALCSKRPYKAPLPENLVMLFFQEQTGRHFDPAVCRAFLGCLDEIHAIKEDLPN